MKNKFLCHKTSLSTKTPVLVAVVVVSLLFANLSLGANRYWFGNDTIEGGSGNWHTGGHFSSTSPTYTPAGLPTTADDVYLQGATSGTINLTTTVTSMKDLYVNTAGYIIDSVTPTVNFRVNNIYGPAANTLTITNSVNTSFNFVISAGFSPSFTGNFTQGTGTLDLRKQGDGIFDLTGAASVSYTGTTQVDGGILRMNISDIGSGNLLLGNVTPYVQGILETNGTFTRSLGASAGEVRMGFGASMRSGFGAYGGALSVNFGGTSGTVNWADTSASNIILQTFVVGTTTSTHTTTVVNPINISVTTAKTIRTENGAAAIDADFSGTISSVAGGSLTKTGDGTTRFNNGISEVNLTVSEGTLIINGTISQTSDRNLTIQSGATLRGYATTSMTAQRNTTVQSDGILAPGRGNVVSDPFGTFSLNGDLALQPNSVLAFGIGAPTTNDQLVRLGGTWSFDPAQRITLYDYGIPTTGVHMYPIITGLTSDPGRDGWQIYNSPGVTGTFWYDSGTIYYVVPEPKQIAIFSLLALMGFVVFRSRAQIRTQRTK